MPEEKFTEEEIKSSDVKGLVLIHKIDYYRGCPVYIRQFKEDIFAYDTIFDNQLYFSYIVVTPEEGKEKLTKKQRLQAIGMIFASATVTIDAIIEQKKTAMISNSVAVRKETKGKRKRLVN